MNRYQKAVVLVPIVLLLSQAFAQRNRRSVDALNNIDVDAKPEHNSRHGHSGGEEAERLKRQAPRLAGINVHVNAADNSKRVGSGRGRNGGKGGPYRPGPIGPARPEPTGPSHPGPAGPVQPEPVRPAQPAPHGAPHADDGHGAGRRPSESCAEGWTYVNKTRKCFKVVVAFNKERYATLWDKCEKIGGKVASIHSAEENAALTAFGNGSIPQEFRREIQWFVLGLHSADGGLNWQWKDGTPLDYVNWAPNEPRTRRDNKEKCAVVTFDGGPQNSLWGTVHCTAVSEWSATGTLCMRDPLH